MKIINSIASILMIIGALNWGLVGLFDCDIVQLIFKRKESLAARITYILIGVAGLYTILYLIF